MNLIIKTLGERIVNHDSNMNERLSEALEKSSKHRIEILAQPQYVQKQGTQHISRKWLKSGSIQS